VKSAAGKIHFSGIGGTAMVAGARLAMETGWEVRGSDTAIYPPASEMVRALGVPVAQGYAPENLDWQPDLVVIGNVLSRGNPEVEAALETRRRYVSLPEWLKNWILRPRRPIVVCGTHGKTSTTALAAYLLDRAGRNPGFFIGGQPLDFPHSARSGPEGAPFVIEGDEYDTAFFDKRAKFFHYLPDTAIVTSLEFDHGDIYADLAEIERAFQRMFRQIPRNGWLLLCADNHAASLRGHAFSNVATYGFDESADWRVEICGGSPETTHLLLYHHDALVLETETGLTGRHNIQNAAAALAASLINGAEAGRLAEALPGFRGVKRRMEVFLERDGVRYIDDFAHHPTAIRETAAAARARWPEARLRVLFEPRSNTTVTRRFQAALTGAFQDADEVWIGPIYRAARIPEAERLDREAVCEMLRLEYGIKARCADSASELAAHILDTARAGDIVLILSNGAFGGIYEKLRNPGADAV
jgi:UDP-N-acetylmuramate: L-alanyl-gamma-D-glutamyl-meso-diaminopimelate ligase